MTDDIDDALSLFFLTMIGFLFAVFVVTRIGGS